MKHEARIEKNEELDRWEAEITVVETGVTTRCRGADPRELCYRMADVLYKNLAGD